MHGERPCTPEISAATGWHEDANEQPRPLRILLARAHPSALSRVRSLDLRRSGVMALPRHLTKFSGITSLDVSHNLLSTIPSDISSAVPALRALNLRSNLLASLPEVRHLGALPRLEELDVRGNPHPYANAQQRSCLLQILIFTDAGVPLRFASQQRAAASPAGTRSPARTSADPARLAVSRPAAAVRATAAGPDPSRPRVQRTAFARLRMLDGRVLSAEDERLALDQATLDRLLSGTSLRPPAQRAGSVDPPPVEAVSEPWRQRLLEVQRSQLASRLGQLRDQREEGLQHRLRALVLSGSLPNQDTAFDDDGALDQDDTRDLHSEAGSSSDGGGDVGSRGGHSGGFSGASGRVGDEGGADGRGDGKGERPLESQVTDAAVDHGGGDRSLAGSDPECGSGDVGRDAVGQSGSTACRHPEGAAEEGVAEEKGRVGGVEEAEEEDDEDGNEHSGATGSRTFLKLMPTEDLDERGMSTLKHEAILNNTRCLRDISERMLVGDGKSSKGIRPVRAAEIQTTSDAAIRRSTQLLDQVWAAQGAAASPHALAAMEAIATAKGSQQLLDRAHSAWLLEKRLTDERQQDARLLQASNLQSHHQRLQRIGQSRSMGYMQGRGRKDQRQAAGFVKPESTLASVAAMLSAPAGSSPARRRGPRKIETVEEITRWGRQQVHVGLNSQSASSLHANRGAYLRRQLENHEGLL